MLTLPAPHRRRQRGTTLLEALVAFLVLSLGMLTVARVQTQLRANSDIARQRSEAVRLAQEDLESLRAFASIAVAAGRRSYDAIASGSHTIDSDSGFATNTRYRVARQIDVAGPPHAKSASVTVSWTDRAGNPQQVALNSVIGGADPAYSGALGLGRTGSTVKGPLGRSIAIPLGAKDLGNGTSVLKPVSTGSVAFVFDNASGAVTSRCAGIAAGSATRELSATDLGHCEAIGTGYLLSGVVRFATGAASGASADHDSLPALTVALALVGGPYPSSPECATEALKTVSFTAAGSLHVEAVPIGSTAASFGLANWTDSGERHVAYDCLVRPSSSGLWSGAVTLVPAGWSIGSGAADQRVCRYTGDLDGSGAIDANIEHPAAYAGVGGALPHQDYLVIDSNQTCPGAQPAAPGGGGTDVAVVGTAPHQP